MDDLERSYGEAQERMSDPTVYNDRNEAATVGRRLKELEGEGIDEVRTTVSYSLAARAHVENLTSVAAGGGIRTATITFTGTGAALSGTPMGGAGVRVRTSAVAFTGTGAAQIFHVHAAVRDALDVAQVRLLAHLQRRRGNRAKDRCDHGENGLKSSRAVADPAMRSTRNAPTTKAIQTFAIRTVVDRGCCVIGEGAAAM